MNADTNMHDTNLSEAVIDIEIQNEIKTNDTNLPQVPLKGILKKPDRQILENIEIEKNIFRLCLGLLFLVTMTPIIVCDLYFGFTDSSCSREEPDELTISLRLYLIVSGFMRLVTMIVMLTTLTCFDPKEIHKKGGCFIFCGSLGLMGVALFNIIWNILGAVVFWGYIIYSNKNCDNTFSTYVFISLLIKFLAAVFAYIFYKRDEKN